MLDGIWDPGAQWLCRESEPFFIECLLCTGSLLTLFYLQPQEASVTGMRRSGLRKFTKLKNQSKSVEAWKDGGDGLIEATSLTPRCPLKGAQQVTVAYPRSESRILPTAPSVFVTLLQVLESS